MKLREVIDKYFRGERMINFYPSDRQGECYLTYRLDGHAEISMGNNDGEIVVMYTSDAEKLDKFIHLLLN